MIKRKSWQDYQKEIADDHYYYARSCIRQNFFPGSEKLFIDMLRNDLGKDLTDDPLHSSCTGIGYHSDIVPLETIMTVVARQFSLMTEAGYENFIPSCITSFGIYSETLEMWHDFPEMEEQAREYLYKATGREFKKPKSLAHTSDVIFHHREEIAAKAKHLLVNAETGKPLNVVEHIGCHYAKIFPKAGIGGSEFPYVLAGMIAALLGQKHLNGPGVSVPETAALAVWLHGKAGDRCAEQYGEYAMLPSDLIEMLPQVLKESEERN